MPRPLRRRVTGTLVAYCMLAGVLLGVSLSGCATQATPSPSPFRSSQPTPVFSSDAQALAAAKKAYAKYLAVSDAIGHDGGKDPERINAVATGGALKHLRKDISDYSSDGIRITGTTTFDSMRVQRRTRSTGESVVVYVCEDVSDVDVLDKDGKSLVQPDRKPRTPFLVTFSGVPPHLLVAKRAVWGGDDFCE